MIDMVRIGSAASAAFESSVKSTPGKPGGGEAAFGDVIQGALKQMGALEQDANTKVDGLLHGKGVDVHSAMIATERSDLAFELALAVRGKAVAAYEQLNSMQF